VLPPLEDIKAKALAAIPGARLEIIPNGSVSAQHSILLDHEHALPVARFLRDDPALRLDYCSNVTGVDWPDAVVKTKIRKVVVLDGA